MPTMTPTEEELHAYLDGMLPQDRRAAVEAHLRGNPRDAERLEAYRADGEAIARLFSCAGETIARSGAGHSATRARGVKVRAPSGGDCGDRRRNRHGRPAVAESQRGGALGAVGQRCTGGTRGAGRRRFRACSHRIAPGNFSLSHDGDGAAQKPEELPTTAHTR